MRRGPTAGRRWPETGSAQLSSNTPCWWRRPAARSSPAAWRRTVALISWAKCRPALIRTKDWTLQTPTPSTSGSHTQTLAHTQLKQEAPVLELSATVALIVLYIKYRFLKLNGSTWMCLISNVDCFIGENCTLGWNIRIFRRFGFTYIRLILTSRSCRPEFLPAG